MCTFTLHFSLHLLTSFQILGLFIRLVQCCYRDSGLITLDYTVLRVPQTSTPVTYCSSAYSWLLNWNDIETDLSGHLGEPGLAGSPLRREPLEIRFLQAVLLYLSGCQPNWHWLNIEGNSEHWLQSGKIIHCYWFNPFFVHRQTAEEKGLYAGSPVPVPWCTLKWQMSIASSRIKMLWPCVMSVSNKFFCCQDFYVSLKVSFSVMQEYKCCTV